MPTSSWYNRLSQPIDHAGLLSMGLASSNQLGEDAAGGGGDPAGGAAKARAGLNLGGLGLMAAPSLAGLIKDKGHRAGHAADLANIAALLVPAADTAQATFRASPGEDPHHKQLMSHGAHELLEHLGYGAFGARALGHAAHAPPGERAGHLLHALGYGTFLAQHAGQAAQDAGLLGKERQGEQFVLNRPGVAPLLELGGLAALAVPTKHAELAEPPPEAPAPAEEPDERGHQVARALEQLDAIKRGKPTLKELGLYGTIGATTGVGMKALTDIINTGAAPFQAAMVPGSIPPKPVPFGRARAIGSTALAGAVAGGLVPVLRDHARARMHEQEIRDYLATMPKEGQANWGRPLPSFNNKAGAGRQGPRRSDLPGAGLAMYKARGEGTGNMDTINTNRTGIAP